MKKCVAYLRFSSEGQKDGSSIERQTEIIEPYASRNGLELVETLIDDGFSASKGHHLSHGKLGGFLKNVDAGKYKGFALVVEKMDRFSRLDIKDTFLLTLRLTNGGMELHLAGSNRIIRSLDDLPTSILNSVEAKAAADYVANLTVNIRRGKEKAKDKTEAGGWVYTRRVPAWLEVVGRQNVGNKITDPGKIVPIPEKVVVVREAFRLAGLGVGVKNIARQLNGSALSLTWITRLLSDRSVLGEFQPAGRDPIPNYFPAIVTQSEFNAAREQAARKRRDGKYVGGSRTSHLAENLFTGLIFDKTNGCGMNFQRVRTHRYLRSAFQPDRKPNGMVYDRFEKAFLSFLEDLDWKAVAGESEPAELKAKQADLETVLSDIDRTSRLVAKLTTLAEDPETVAIALRQLAQAENKLAELNDRHEKLTGEVEAIRATSAALYTPEDLLAAIRSNESNDVRLRLKAEIRRRISRIDLHFGLDGWKAVADVQFVNGVIRALIFTDTKILVIKGEGTI